MAENIRNWIVEEVAPAAKPRRYRSKHAGTKPVSTSTFTAAAAPRVIGTFGRLVKDTIKPGEYTRAGERCGKGVSRTSKPKRFQRPTGPRKAPLVKHDDAPLHGIKAKKNYVVANAVDNILAAPPARTKKVTPRWTAKSDYGKVPAYLDDVKGDIEAERELIATMIEAAEADDDDGPGARAMGDDEREALLDALKARWDAVNHEYQKITFKNISTSSSTIGAIRAKEECETTLKQLEADIARLETKGPVYVVDDE